MKERVVQTLDRLNVVNSALLKAESDGARLTMLNFARYVLRTCYLPRSELRFRKLADEAVILEGISSGNIWEKILENEEDAKKIEESFKRMDEHTKNFHVRATIYEHMPVLMQSFSA
jgi:L-fucose isomerase-like protein